MAEFVKLKHVIEVVWSQMTAEETSRSNLPSILRDLNKKSYLVFAESYVSFMNNISAVDKGADEFNHWLSTQMLVVTFLENDEKLLSDLYLSFKTTLLGTEGGNAADIFKYHEGNASPGRSFLVLLAFRVYLDTLFVAEESPNE